MSNPADKDVFDRIRQGCAAVAARAVHVRIREEPIAAYADSLATTSVAIPPLDAVHHVIGKPAETLAFFVTLDAINFGSGFFPHLRKRPGLSGYFTIATSLTDRFRAAGPLSPDQLATIDAEACATIFGQESASAPIRELMSLFARAWNDLGRDLLERFGGRFRVLIEAANGSAARLVDLLREQEFFRDESDYSGLLVPLHKRSQLLASDLALVFGGHGLGRFDDLDRLTIFADNLVPHVLRRDGLLEYSAPLAEAIDREELIPAGSDAEIEIRACAVHVVELICEALLVDGVAVTSRQLDQILWHRGQHPEIKQAGKRHRTRTVFY